MNFTTNLNVPGVPQVELSSFAGQLYSQIKVYHTQRLLKGILVKSGSQTQGFIRMCFQNKHELVPDTRRDVILKVAKVALSKNSGVVLLIM